MPKNLESFFQPGVILTGKLVLPVGSSVIAGQVDGDIDASGFITLEHTAKIVGNLEVERVLVRGQVTGNIHAKHEICLAATARVRGNLSAPRLNIETGAVLNGQIAMTE